jgi:diacylglycerol O-acyltransferase / wax synthase
VPPGAPILDDCAMGIVEGVIGERRAPLRRAWLRVGRRADGRAPLWIELAVIGWLFWLYDVINDWAPIRQLLAVRNAMGVLSLEHSLHLDPELTLNHWLAAHSVFAAPAAYYYFFAHAVVTFALLAWLWWSRPALYVRLRTQLVIINLIAFVVFWRYPLAPPRMFPALGYRDVIASSHALVSWHSAVLVHDADQLAAMPSLHVAWAAWCGLAIWQLHRRRAVAVLAIAYPLLTSFVVIATGNHYLLDVFAGFASVLLALALHWALERALAVRQRRKVAVLERTDRAVPGLRAPP